MEINIINFQDKFEKDFYDLNIEWLEYFFQVEDYDYEVLSNSKKYIINKGGEIFFAESEGNIIGTVALMPTKNKLVFELTKMAVKPEYRNKGIGKKLLKKCIDYSKSNNLNIVTEISDLSFNVYSTIAEDISDLSFNINREISNLSFNIYTYTPYK